MALKLGKWIVVVGLCGGASVAMAAVQLPVPSGFSQSHHAYQNPHTSVVVAGSDHIQSHAQIVAPPQLPDNFIAYPNRYTPEHQYTSPALPASTASSSKAVFLTLQGAIALALRYNPDVENSELTRITDKYTLLLAKREFVPAYTLDATDDYAQFQKPVYSLSPSVTVKTPIGTTFSASYANTVTGSDLNFGSLTFSAMQPLLNGFGAVNRITLLDAYSTEEEAKFAFEDSVISVVDSVITQYRQLVSDYRNLAVQKRFLAETKQTVDQYKLQVKVGQLAPSDLVQQEAQYAQNQISFVQEQDSVRSDYITFLQELGLTLNAKIKVNQSINVKKYKIPSQAQAIKTALKFNTTYRSDLINLTVAKRNVLQAKNARLPTLDVTATQEFGPGVTTTPLGFPNNAAWSVGIKASVPIDNVEGKADEVEADVAVEQAKIALEQQKETLISTIINDVQGIQNDYRLVVLGEQSVKLQGQTYRDAKIKLRYGQTTVFEVNQDQSELLSEQLSLISDKISYLNAIEQLYSDMGTTLHRWHIKLRY